MSKMWHRVAIIHCLLFFQTVMISHVDSTPGKNETKTSSGRKEYPKDLLLRTSFGDWKKWKVDFPQCDPKRNPYMSPINILTSKVTQDSDLKPIIVHAGLPAEECLFLSTIHKDDDLEMEVVNIFPEPICQEQITYISGAGESPTDMRYFRRAFIFFSGRDVSPPQSLHQFDGKSFQMEIAMEFTSVNGTDVTEIHLMVEAHPEGEVPANPVFKSIEDALIDLKTEIADESSGNTETAKKRNKLKEGCDTAETAYHEAFAEHEKGGKNGTNLHERLRQLKNLISEIKHLRDADLEALIKEIDEDKKTLEGDKSNSAEEQCAALSDKKKELIELANEDEEKAKELNEDIKKAHAEVMACLEEIKKLKRKAKKGKNDKKFKLENIVELLKDNKVGIPGESKAEGILFDSPDKIFEERDQILESINRLGSAERQYQKKCREYAHYNAEMRYAFVPIEGPLQIAWLFPSHAGYFYYKGSNPIPKCERTLHSIVIDTPISITTGQLKLFQDLPSLSSLTAPKSTGNESGSASSSSSSSSSSSIGSMIPVLNSDFDQNIRRVKKGPVFLKDDGFHIRSSQEHMPRPDKWKGRRGLISDNDSLTSFSTRINQGDPHFLHKVASLMISFAWTWVINTPI